MDVTAARIFMVQNKAAEITERQEKVNAKRKCSLSLAFLLNTCLRMKKGKKAAYNNACVVEVEVVCVVCGTELGTG
jgi:hypothetical protein